MSKLLSISNVSLQLGITSAKEKPHHFDWNEHTAPPNMTEVHGRYPFPKHPFHPRNDTSDGGRHTAPPNITDIHGTYPFPKDPFQPLNDTIDDSPELAERRKRDIRSDILENELQAVIGAYNSEILSQARSTTNAILSRVANLNAHRNLLAFSFNNLATSGFNDVSVLRRTLSIEIDCESDSLIYSLAAWLANYQLAYKIATIRMDSSFLMPLSLPKWWPDNAWQTK